MAIIATPEHVNEIVHVDPMFSGHRTGILKSVGEHPSQTGMKVHQIDFGDGDVQALIDWKVMVLEENETVEDVFGTPTTATPTSKKAGLRKPRTLKEKRNPELAADGNPPPGYKFSVLGSGKLTKSNFYPGEDATAKSILLKVERGQMRRSEIPAPLVEFVKTNEKWNRQFGKIIELDNDLLYENTQEAKKQEAADRAAAMEAQTE